MGNHTEKISTEGAKKEDRVVSLQLYRLQKSLREEGFDLIKDESGKLTLVLRMGKG